MKIEGNYKINASRELIWQLLNDPEVLGNIAPGVKSLEQIEEDHYRATFEVKVGPVSGAFKGKIMIKDKVEPEKYSLHVEAKSPIGIVFAEVSISLQSDGNSTLVLFSGDAKISGVLARTGQRMMSAVAKKMTDQMFEALERKIE